METRRKKYIDSSTREKWDKIFNSLVRMLEKQQSQLETLSKERELLEDQIKLQYDRRATDVKFFKDQILQLKKNIKIQDMVSLLQAEKYEFLSSFKQKEVLLCRLKSEGIDSDLEDFKALFDLLSKKCTDPKDNEHGKELHHKEIEVELKRIKIENKKLKTKKDSEVSALMSERNFVWNQYKTMEADLMDELRSKRSDVEFAKLKIEELLKQIEQLQSANVEKESLISRLRSNISELETKSTKKSEEIARLSTELELHRKSSSSPATPVLSRCKKEPKKSRLNSQNSRLNMTITERKELPSEARVLEKRSSRNRKRLVAEETPKLFTSAFKVPKLKCSSSPRLI